jgi:Na+-driven multidrug efflux pump
MMERINSILLSAGLLLLVTGVRLIMVRNSLKASKPSPERLKSLHKEFLYLLPAGVIVFLIGFFSPHFQLSVEQAKNIANTGLALFGLGIPQYCQWQYGRGTDKQVKNFVKRFKIWAWVIAIIGAVLVLVPPILERAFNLN